MKPTRAKSSYANYRPISREFEQKYQRSSAEFYQQFQAGQTSDAMDYVEWASLIQMADNLTKRLRLLGGEASG